ncbi:hypothetical protein [Vibrio phage VpV262]|uniref:Uncharacterized protein n=1 Tax=Vibrio phage VpV262 TaxID=2907796 RepID=Q8LT97_9CAUD|nr:hypothetical protein VpV262p02 [Vibrio phage VpV262]AAM28350.1 hypothetical protein [Vibrio phage VpV262]
MKLRESIAPLRDAVSGMPALHGHQTFFENMASQYEHCKIKCVNPIHAMRWNVWFAIPKTARDRIIVQSVGTADYVGGYFESVNDSHIDSLLRKAMPHDYMARFLAHAQLKAAKQGR